MYEDILLSHETEELADTLRGLSERCSVGGMDDARLALLAGILKHFQLLRGAGTVSLVDGRYLTREMTRTAYCVVVVSQSLAGYGSHGQMHRHALREAYQLCLVELPWELGNVMIRPGRLGDRLAGLFVRREVEFPEHDEFSRKYHVAAADPDRVRAAFRRPLLDAVSAYDELLIEINGGALLVMKGRPLNRFDALDLAEAAFAIRRAAR